MNHIIACTLGLLGAGAFCAHGETSAVSTDGKPVPPEKDQSSATANPAGQASGVIISRIEQEKVEGIKGAAYSVTTMNGTAPGEMKISVTPKMDVSSAELSVIPRQGEVFFTRKATVPSAEKSVSGVSVSSVEVDKAGAVRETGDSVKTTEKPGSEKMEIRVAPRQEGSSVEAAPVPGTGEVVISRAVMEGGGAVPVPRFVTWNSANSGAAIITMMNAEKVEGVEGAVYTITAKGAAPGSMKISVAPGKEENGSHGEEEGEGTRRAANSPVK